MQRVLLFVLLAGIRTVLPAQSDSTAQQKDTAYLSPTIVTVTRTPVELSRAPFAVGIANRGDIQRGKPGLALDEALIGIAGVQVDNRFNYALGERISIRGFGARAQFGVRGVRVLLDGIPMTLADGQTSLNNVDVANVARVEVIRGPASAMHGNAAGGVIQLTTDRPDEITARALGGSVRADFGDDDLRRTQVAIAGGRGATSYRLTGSRLTFGGYRDWNTARNEHADFGVSRSGARRDVKLTGSWVAYDAKNPGSLSNALLVANRRQAFANNKNFKTGEKGKQGQIGVTWDEQLGGVRMQFAAHGLQRHVDNPIPQRIVVIDRDAGGVRLTLSGTPVRALRLSTGSELQLQRDDRRNFVSLNGSRGADTLDQLERVNNTAVFAQASAELAPSVLLMTGARYDRIRFNATDRLIGTGNPDDSGERTMNAMSPSVGITWSVSSLVDLYSNYSTSFETPTTSELANQATGAGGFNPTLEPQRTRSLEMGVNGRVHLPGIAGSYQVAAYEARVRDALIPFEVPSVPGRQYFRNVGSTRHRGVETATSLVFPWGLSLRASFTHTEARFVSYAVTTGTSTAIYDGNPVPGVAPNRGDATLSFQPSKAFIDFETRASSSTPVNDANAERSPSYVVHSLRVGARGVRASPIEVSPYVGVQNVFDRKYNTSVVVNAFGGRYYEPGPPRSLYGGVNVTF